MNLLSNQSHKIQARRRTERGAALLTMLMLATLLLSAGGALLLTTTMSATNSMDSTAEMQAFYGAEVGLQQTMNALRGNVFKGGANTPNIDLRSVVEPNTSNVAGDPATNSNVARLSTWLPYTDTANYPTVIRVGNADNNGANIAYQVTVKDLDGDTKIVSYSTTGTFEAGSSGCTVGNGGRSLTCGSAGNTFTITYVPQASTTVTAYPAIASNLGSFSVARTGSGASIAAGSPAGFRLTVNQTGPWTASDHFISNVSGNVTAAASTLSANFSGSHVKASGTAYALCGACDPLALPTGATTVQGTVTAPQPRRILVQSTGYGPKGAVKRLEMVVKKSVFDFDAPAVLTMRGSDDGTAAVFGTGSSNAKEYSGVDYAGSVGQLPTFAISGADISIVNSGISKPGTVADPELGVLDNSHVPTGNAIPNIAVRTPDFLETADAARELLDGLEGTARTTNRYYSGSHTVTSSNTSATSLTFVDGNCNLDGGSGLVVVTGNLTMNGNPNFSGVILVLGGGTVTRDGGGNGNIYGALVIAKFDRDGSGGFQAPSFTTNGGGNSLMQYDSLAVTKATATLDAIPGGMREF